MAAAAAPAAPPAPTSAAGAEACFQCSTARADADSALPDVLKGCHTASTWTEAQAFVPWYLAMPCVQCSATPANAYGALPHISHQAFPQAVLQTHAVSTLKLRQCTASSAAPRPSTLTAQAR